VGINNVKKVKEKNIQLLESFLKAGVTLDEKL